MYDCTYTDDIVNKIHEMELYIRKKENALDFMKQSLLKNLIYKSGLEKGYVIKKDLLNVVIKDFKLFYCSNNNKYELAVDLVELSNLYTIPKDSNIIYNYEIQKYSYEIIGKFNFDENLFIG